MSAVAVIGIVDDGTLSGHAIAVQGCISETMVQLTVLGHGSGPVWSLQTLDDAFEMVQGNRWVFCGIVGSSVVRVEVERWDQSPLLPTIDRHVTRSLRVYGDDGEVVSSLWERYTVSDPGTVLLAHPYLFAPIP